MSAQLRRLAWPGADEVELFTSLGRREIAGFALSTRG
jgi:hypothetical protein